MSDLCDLAATVIDHHTRRGVKVDAFVVPTPIWLKETALCPYLIADPHAKEGPSIMGIPVALGGDLVQCVEISLDYCRRGKIGWILNLNPFRNMVIKPAFDEGEPP